MVVSDFNLENIILGFLFGSGGQCDAAAPALPPSGAAARRLDLRRHPGRRDTGPVENKNSVKLGNIRQSSAGKLPSVPRWVVPSFPTAGTGVPKLVGHDPIVGS